MEYDLTPLREYLNEVETLVSPARHLPADRPGVITGGYGETSPSLVHVGMVVSLSLAREWRDKRLVGAQAKVARLLDFLLTQGQMIALIDFEYNLGEHALLVESTLFKLVEKRDFHGALAEFKRWDMANGKHLLGLQRRRHVEENWFEKGVIT